MSRERDRLNYEKYHANGQNIQAGVWRYWEDQTGEPWHAMDVSEMGEEDSKGQLRFYGTAAAKRRWKGVQRMYSTDAWRKLGAKWPEEKLR
jgi:hypothetical protein